uniref:NADH-ubiquinone oxidoreductase chain 6 n=2 Tax=Oscarella TaxID=121493 RepID=A0A289ZAC9_OSCPE|nr:NADH dehydrogenase subunit 6 [Oscarella pearsei]ATA66357.1 NADH dehydrogenase subunit 6 [Oscarella pearsei]ATA66369.1 NADH dehydrogenase subunit 6 [Oscarella balibaloi]
MEGLFYIFALGVIISGIMVISALNPIHSVFWLIVVFLGASALFILLGIDFIALIFLIVYVGAIAILFLFVIMMLNLTDLEGGGDMSNYIPIGSVIGVLLLFEVLIMGREATAYSYRDIDHEYLKGDAWDASIEIIKSSNIEVLGRILYTDYYYLFIIASFILLVAMIGAIVLTHELGAELKRQDLFTQTSRLLWQ